MSTEVLAPERERRYRRQIPEAHQRSMDTRVAWLWNQRVGTVQSIWEHSPDVLDKTAATMILQALLGKDLPSIALIFRRLEGGPVPDEVIADDGVLTI